MAQIEEGGRMRRVRAIRALLIAVACAAGFLETVPAARAATGQYIVGICKADELHQSTEAFASVADPGLEAVPACTPLGLEPRSLKIGNVLTNNGRVRDGKRVKLTMAAPGSTVFKRFRWGGFPVWADCHYQMELWADGGGLPAKSINSFRGKKCRPGPKAHSSAKYRKSVDISGRTRIVIRVQCNSHSREGCLAKAPTYLEIFQAQAIIVDQAPPVVAITPDTPLARGEWVKGDQPLNYDATDNVGVKSADAIVAGVSTGTDVRPCAFAVINESYETNTPCPNGPSQVNVVTDRIPEGSQLLQVSAVDPANNVGSSASVIARVDRTAPGRVDVAVQGGDAWRPSNDFAVAWTNPAEPDRAPIVAATYQLCPAGDGSCMSGVLGGEGMSGFQIPVPGPGQWSLSVWRRDAAGNETEAVASVPVMLRYDPDPPQLGFEAPSASDPTLVAVDVSDNVSGLATGSIEISQSGSNIWQVLPTQLQGDQLVARIDDAALPAGSYVLRAHASDQAHNEASTDLRLDGQPMAVSLPLRTVTAVQAGFRTVRTHLEARRRHGRTERIRRRVTVTVPSIKVSVGAVAHVAGRLVNAAGQGVAGQQINVFSSSSVAAEQLVAQVQTNNNGSYSYAAPGVSSRTLRFAFAGSSTTLPAQASITMTVPALTSFGVDRRRLHNGQTVTFSGALRTMPAPPPGKLLELQARLPGRWETFRTIRTDAAGRWTARYHFTRTRGVQRYRFRVRLPEEAGYPFAAGGSRELTVEVRGR